jgi:hypothetical protein
MRFLSSSHSATHVLGDVLTSPAHWVSAVLALRVVEDFLSESFRGAIGTALILKGKLRTNVWRRRIWTHTADIDSKPTAKPISISSFLIWFATLETAINPDEQNLKWVKWPDTAAVSVDTGRRAISKPDIPVDDLYRNSDWESSGNSRGASIVRGFGRKDHT